MKNKKLILILSILVVILAATSSFLYYTKNKIIECSPVLSSILQEEFGISAYNIININCDPNRGGYIKTEVEDLLDYNISKLKIYYHWGWCSSGGADCGRSICFSTESIDKFNEIRNKLCDKLGKDSPTSENLTQEDRNLISECNSKKFEKVIGNKKVFSIDLQIGGRRYFDENTSTWSPRSDTLSEGPSEC